YVDSVDSFGFTPLHYATWADRKSVMMLLVGFDADIIARSQVLHKALYNLPPGSTPLHIACLMGDLDRVKLLLRAYYETTADLLPSQTALLNTAERRRRARSHPDPRFILTRTQKLPFHIAARAGHRHLLDWLDPSIPLMFLLGGEEGETAAPGGPGEGQQQQQQQGAGGLVALVGVSRLTVIAAKALHRALVASLDSAEEDIRRHEAAAAAAAARRRRREERRLAKEAAAAAAAAALKQGKNTLPGANVDTGSTGLGGRLRRLLAARGRQEGEGGGGGSGAAAAAAGRESGGFGWRPWRSRTVRRGRKKATGAPAGVAAAVAEPVAAPATLSTALGNSSQRSPRRRRRRSATGVTGRVAAPTGVAAATTTTVAQSADGVESLGDGGDGVAAVYGSNESAVEPSQPPEALQPPGPPSGIGILNTNLRLRIFRSSNSQRQQQQRSSRSEREDGAGSSTAADGLDGSSQPAGPSAATAAAAAAPPAAGNVGGGGGTAVLGSPTGVADGSGGSGGGGGLALSLTRTVLQRLYRVSSSRQSNGAATWDAAQAQQLNERLMRAGITIPDGPDEAVAYFTLQQELPQRNAAAASQAAEAAASNPGGPLFDSEPDLAPEPNPDQDLLSPALSAADPLPIRSAGASRAPSCRTSFQLPGTAAGATSGSGSGSRRPSSGLIPPSVLPPGQRRRSRSSLSDDGGGAAAATVAAGGTSSSEERQPQPRQHAAAAAAAAVDDLPLLSDHPGEMETAVAAATVAAAGGSDITHGTTVTAAAAGEGAGGNGRTTA
ncbi:hypothetical protein VOLCADRAFT_101298, partial [Volvox carteri f. nagariensis]